MLPEKELAEKPEVDFDADDDAGEAGHDKPTDDEIDGGEGDDDAGGGDADAGEDDLAGEDEGQGGEETEVKARKGNPEFGRLRRERREAAERADRAERELNDLRQRGPQKDPSVAAAEERARLELMSPDERTDYLVNKTRQETRSEVQQLRFEMVDNSDRSRFDSLCARNPVFSDLADEVERQLTMLRRNGGNSTREVVAKFILGDRAVKRASQQSAKQTKRGKDNIRRQTTKPANSGSDRQPENRRGGNDRTAREKRLKDVPI